MANAPISSLSRGFQALATAGFLALGMLVGNRIGVRLGLNYEPDATTTPLAASLIGAAIGVLGLAVAWSMPRRQLLPTVAISVVGWSIVSLFSDRSGDQTSWPVYAVAAGVVGITAAVAAELQSSSSSVYTVGAVCFARRWPRLVPERFSYHEVWHAFTLAAAGLHFTAITTLAT